MDHISFSVNDFEHFNDDEEKMVGYVLHDWPFFWIGQEFKLNLKEHIGKSIGFHIAFKTPSIEAIHLWRQKCIDLGGVDEHAPHPGFMLCLLFPLVVIGCFTSLW